MNQDAVANESVQINQSQNISDLIQMPTIWPSQRKSFANILSNLVKQSEPKRKTIPSPFGPATPASSVEREPGITEKMRR